MYTISKPLIAILTVLTLYMPYTNKRIKILCLITWLNLIPTQLTAISHYLLMLLLVLGSSAGDGGLACSTSLIILCLYVAHPVGGFLVVGDEVFSMEGLNFDISMSNIPSSQLEELHQQ